MINMEIFLLSLKKKHILNEMIINNLSYTLFAFEREKDKNYIIFKKGDCDEDEVINVQSFINSLKEKKFKNASFVFVAFVKNDFEKDYYTGFNGNSFLHIISYNLLTSTIMYDKNFYYFGSKKIKQLLFDIENILSSNTD